MLESSIVGAIGAKTPGRRLIGIIGTACALALSFSVGAKASLIGDSVTFQRIVNDSVLSTLTTTVGAGTEFSIGTSATTILVDVEADHIIVRVNGFNPFGGGPQVTFGTSQNSVRLLDLDWVDMPSGEITGVSLGEVTDVTNIELGDITPGPHSIDLSLTNSTWQFNTSVVRIDLITNHSGTIAEPATLAVFGLGLAGLGVARRGRTAYAAAVRA